MYSWRMRRRIGEQRLLSLRAEWPQEMEKADSFFFFMEKLIRTAVANQFVTRQYFEGDGLTLKKLRWTAEPKRLFCVIQCFENRCTYQVKRFTITTKEYQPRKLETSR